jgi:uncharacterized membrane protein YcaP (DUF421 family)
LWNNIWGEYIKDWNTHSFQDNLAQIIAVVIILFLGILAIKIIGKKSINTLTIPNILFIFVLSSTLGALITKPYRIFTGILVCATIVLFIFFLEKMIVKFNLFEQFFISKPTILYENGQFLIDNISKSKMTIDQIESWIRIQGFPSIEVCKTIIIEFGGNLSFEVKPEYEPIKKIYFDKAIEQILKAIDEKQFYEEAIPDIKKNLFEEASKGYNQGNINPKLD